MKIQLMVIFGGKSVEHEISVISAMQAIHNIDTEKYDVIPVYLTKDLDMYTGDEIGEIESYRNLPALLKSSQRVILSKDGDRVYLTNHPRSRKVKRVKALIDIAFPIVHGYNVEDGTLQGYLKTMGLPFVGCDVISSAVGMDKYIMKTALHYSGLPVLDCIQFNKFDFEANADNVMSAICEKFSYPVIVKPATSGSSIGISKASSNEELREALNLAFSFATCVLIEPAITSLREINCSVIGDLEEAEASECEEPLNATSILSYEDKYMGSGSKSSGSKGAGSQGMASLTRQIPADITPEMRAHVRNLAIKTFKALGCNGIVRIDFLYDTSEDKIYVNEINTIPGSLSFYLWEALGIPYKKLIDRLIQITLKRVRDEKNLLSSFETNVLSMASSSLGGSKGGKLKV